MKTYLVKYSPAFTDGIKLEMEVQAWTQDGAWEAAYIILNKRGLFNIHSGIKLK